MTLIPICMFYRKVLTVMPSVTHQTRLSIIKQDTGNQTPFNEESYFSGIYYVT